MKLNKNQKTFFALVKAGLWGDRNTHIRINGTPDWNEVYLLAQEQAVQGLVLQGLEWSLTHGSINKDSVSQELLLQWIGNVQMLEQWNQGMNQFLYLLQNKLSEGKIKVILVKGQGIAQYYERPLWRAAGDIDLLLNSENYERAKSLLIPFAEYTDKEHIAGKHFSIKIKGYDVELHGSMPFALSKRVDSIIDEVIEDALERNGTCGWNLNGKEILLPDPNNHIILVFTHFLHHFFVEGVGLRQICDWCRVLWTYRESLNYGLLELRIKKMGLMTEWKAFASLAVEWLGMPVEAMPLYDSWFNNKGERVLGLVLETGNFGHNKDLSYRVKYSGISYKIISLFRRCVDFMRFVFIFPIDSPRFFITYIFSKI